METVDNEVQRIGQLIGILDATKPRAIDRLSSPLWKAKKVRLLRYQRGKLAEQERELNSRARNLSAQTENMMNQKAMGPFAKIFAIQSFVPNGNVDPKAAISQRSVREWNEIPWKGTPRWRKFFWNGGGGSTGVRRKLALFLCTCMVFINRFYTSIQLL